MQKTSPKTIYLKDYKAPDYQIDTVDLCFVLDEEEVSVTSKLFCRIQKSDRENPPLVLAGKDLSPVSISLDGDRLFSDDYTADDGTLTLFHPPDSFVLEIETRLRPQENTSLEGLYRSSGNFCTQCEAEGFRKITYFLDRPDIMTRYT
ncbi:MAG: aminopeptidase N, partial [Desulfobulbaceae bacterium]|nr:aminopeptidase N [Desulfobulbaceae bacterium]